MGLVYDDRNLYMLFDSLSPKERLRALKGAFRREANNVRRVAVNNLRGSIRSDRDLERGIRALVFKRKAGFRVTIGTKSANKKTGKGEAGYHTNRQGLKKPVLIWAEEGTVSRKVKHRIWAKSKTGKEYPSWGRFKGAGGGFRMAGKGRGCMKRYGFMRKTLDQVKNTVTDSLHKEIHDYIHKVAKKHGCT